MITNQSNKLPSEGEEFLADFFTSMEIKFETEKKIEGLKDDSKKYRTADFYLPKFKVYVEFFGLWNNTGNDEYKQKKEVYWKNKIPCIYIYPENLGIIGYTFDKRIQSVLLKHGLTKELKKYKLYKLKESKKLTTRIAIIAFCIFLLYNAFFSGEIKLFGWPFIISTFLVALYQCFSLYELYMDIFKRNKYLSEY